jgi:hypothetical protein
MTVTRSAALTQIETSWTGSVTRLDLYNAPKGNDQQRKGGAGECGCGARRRE